jgi:hypothetical protein
VTTGTAVLGFFEKKDAELAVAKLNNIQYMGLTLSVEMLFIQPFIPPPPPPPPIVISKYKYEIPNKHLFPESAWTPRTVDHYMAQNWNIGANHKNFLKMAILAQDIIVDLRNKYKQKKKFIKEESKRDSPRLTLNDHEQCEQLKEQL